ncbi:MAG TPA: hypothetical protein VK816_04355 [Jatrophihabitantaceae bacterium]|jgi:hypothetical protein|nr:hypothetical protein [Jatrophihabitantaceae bacterium]
MTNRTIFVGTTAAAGKIAKTRAIPGVVEASAETYAQMAAADPYLCQEPRRDPEGGQPHPD